MKDVRLCFNEVCVMQYCSMEKGVMSQRFRPRWHSKACHVITFFTSDGSADSLGSSLSMKTSIFSVILRLALRIAQRACELSTMHPPSNFHTREQRDFVPCNVFLYARVCKLLCPLFFSHYRETTHIVGHSL